MLGGPFSDSLKVTARVKYLRVVLSLWRVLLGIPSPIMGAHITVTGNQLPKRVDTML
jgi:hypothetical protein